ncbi:MAG: DUF4342 domain-containing protein [Chloroflexota bacterium]
MQNNNTNDTVNDLMTRGQETLQKVNQRHVIIRKADGTQLADVNMSTIAIIALLLIVFQPLGTIITIGGIAYAVYSKLKITMVHDMKPDEDTFEVDFTQSRK